MNTAKSRNPQSPTLFRPLALASKTSGAAQPGLHDLLRTFHADAVYERAEGDYLFRRKGETLTPVLDLIGGFGTNLLGHNHPDVLDELRRLIDARVPFSAQVSLRPGQMELERLLRARLGDYRLIVTNSGAETIEAALKHAFLERRQDTFWAVRGSFHGKTLGSIQLTYGHCEPFKTFGPRVRFLNPWDASSWDECEAEAAQVSGAVIEPILGEGGIVPLPSEFVEWLGGVCRKSGIPLIVDEIQTGLGRTGTFLASEKLGLEPDYICLSKALGGGVTKIGALLIKGKRFIEGFSLMHTSTFAGDEISCRIACRVLEILERDAVPERAAAAGSYLLEKLAALQKAYPAQIRDIRGEGLLVGVELGDASLGGSKILRAIAQHDLLGNIASSYFLNVHDIRIAPSLSNPATLRIEPSAYIELSDLRRFKQALEMFCQALSVEDVPHVVGHLVGRPRATKTAAAPPRYRRLNREQPETTRRVAFVVHAIDAEDLLDWDPSLASFDVAALDDLVMKATQFLGPVSYDELHVQSPVGPRVHLSVIGLFYTSEHLFRAYRSRDREHVLDQLERAVALAHERGCTVAGLGGFHSIISSNGRRLRDPAVGLTTGNSLTVGMGVRALEAAALQAGIDISEATLGVVGATGNIAQAYALLMAKKVRQLVLVTRPGGARRCRLLVQQLRELAPWIEPVVSESPDALRSCSLIVSASNSAEPVVYSHHLGQHRTVICDISLPPDISAEVRRKRSDVIVIKGGVVRLPCNSDLIIPGVPLAPGHVFACMAETLLMGLEDVAGHGSYGPLTTERVRWALDMADKHGFTLAELQTASLL
ncbi:MAG TPA: aminotransferase class III-fold pyridoxal phosphate-dependent enzyme [Pyrinomonadaceae bacterium]|jgi:acetylornithine/succinyldiaminopimelate/putrescine aminotransferase/predicted amino acid dehydrogenase